MKRIVRLTESDLARIVRRVIKESEDMTIPANLGFGIADSPVGRVVDNSNQPVESWLPSVNLIIKGGAKVTKTSNTQCTMPGLLYFRKDGSKAGSKVDTGDMAGAESAKAIAGQSISKTIYFDCSTGTFYTFYDSKKITFDAISFPATAGTARTTKFSDTRQFFQEKICGMSSQKDLASAFEV